MSASRLRRIARRAACGLILAAPALAGAGGDALAGAGPWVVRAWFGDEAMVREVASWGEHFAWYPEKGFLVAEVERERLLRLRELGFFVETAPHDHTEQPPDIGRQKAHQHQDDIAPQALKPVHRRPPRRRWTP